MTKDTALVAMSGGVDSAVASFMLKNDYDITGITMRLWSESEQIDDDFSPKEDTNSLEAKKIAKLLGFSHVTVALGESFRQSVIAPFIEDYHKGRTPNPCVFCNRSIKFEKLFELADKMGIRYLATGHYAIIDKTDSGSFVMKKAIDSTKDQSYFLWPIRREYLSRILFPLGRYTKSEIRRIADQNSFSNAHKSDSQDICFIPSGDYIDFLKSYGMIEFKPGTFIDTQGNPIGQHSGIECYTIGQRKGLGIALGEPMFVGRKNCSDNTITLCKNEELFSDYLTASHCNFLTDERFDTPVRLEAKIRYRHSPALATVERIGEDRISVRFDIPQRAIASGQSVVLYDGDIVVAGGLID